MKIIFSVYLFRKLSQLRQSRGSPAVIILMLHQLQASAEFSELTEWLLYILLKLLTWMNIVEISLNLTLEMNFSYKHFNAFLSGLFFSSGSWAHNWLNAAVYSFSISIKFIPNTGVCFCKFWTAIGSYHCYLKHVPINYQTRDGIGFYCVPLFLMISSFIWWFACIIMHSLKRIRSFVPLQGLSVNSIFFGNCSMQICLWSKSKLAHCILIDGVLIFTKYRMW